MFSQAIATDPKEYSRCKYVAVIDDDEFVRDSTARLLAAEGYRVLCFASGDAFLNAHLPVSLSCAVLDLSMPGRSGLDVLRALRERAHRPSVLLLTGHGEIHAAVEAMKLGAVDFVEKPCPPDALIAAVEGAAESHERAQALWSERRSATALVESLSDRKRQVLAGISKGSANKVIAYQLGLSVRTVEAYRAGLLSDLGVRSTAEAVRIAIAAGMVPHEEAGPWPLGIATSI